MTQLANRAGCVLAGALLLFTQASHAGNAVMFSDGFEGEYGIEPPVIAALSISKVDSADPVLAADALSYAIVVTNAGPDAATKVRVVDTLPPDMSFASASGDGWVCAEEAGIVTCDLAALANQAQSTLTMQVTAPAQSGVVENSVTVESLQDDPVPGDNVASQQTTIIEPEEVGVAALSISKIDSSDPVFAGDMLSYAITVSNAGPDAANAVSVVDTLPIGMAFVSADGDGWVCVDAAGVVSCDRAMLAAGAQSVLTVHVEAPLDGGSVENSATVSAFEDDPDAADNQASQQTAIIGPGDCGFPSFTADFDVPDALAWPAPWINAGGVAEASLVGGRAYLRPAPTGYSLARTFAPVDTRDVEVLFDLRIESETTQGVGFYVRQNGGHLTTTDPTGAGYAVFLEGTFRGLPGIGVWREVAGAEIQIAHSLPAVEGLDVATDYRVRFRVRQVDAVSTLLQARFWKVENEEPLNWQVSALDNTVSLQNVTGGIAVDSWSSVVSPGAITSGTFVDNIHIEPLCDPLASIDPLASVANGLQFAEGPVWRNDHLLFSDIAADTIYRLAPEGPVPHRVPSGEANGLAIDIDGALVAAEHQNRRISRQRPTGNLVQTVAEFHEGQRLNSPNDIVVRSDGTLYFTDPDYGLADPGTERELQFNGLFGIPPGPGTVPMLYWEADPSMHSPNGVALSPDERTLYVTDSEHGDLLAWTVAPDGALSDMRLLAQGLFIPDGLCVDLQGNIYVTTWANSVEVYGPDGFHQGSILLPESATNCAFGGADGRQLYVTGLTTLYATQAPIAGAQH